VPRKERIPQFLQGRLHRRPRGSLEQQSDHVTQRVRRVQMSQSFQVCHFGEQGGNCNEAEVSVANSNPPGMTRTTHVQLLSIDSQKDSLLVPLEPPRIQKQRDPE
jgi:hypothetical protein